MGVGEFFIIFSIIVGTYLIAKKILTLIEWKMKYNVSVKESMGEINEFIHNDDLER